MSFAGALEACRSACERDGMSAMDWFDAKCATARQSMHRGIKDRARRMRADRFRLGTVHGELVHASGARAVAIASACVEREQRMPRRWAGFGGEVQLMNALAALVVARWDRRFERVNVPAYELRALDEAGRDVRLPVMAEG